MFHPVLGLSGDTVLDEFKDVMHASLNDGEQFKVASDLDDVARAYSPGGRYRAGRHIEEERVDSLA